MSPLRRLGVIFFFVSVVSGQAGTLAQFRTTLGDIAVELYDQDKPATVRNFIRYVQSGRYTNDFSHRLIPGFVLQAGGYNITNRGQANWSMTTVPADPPVTNEFGTGRFYSNVFGTLAMAKSSDPNSATSQFFFNLADNSVALDSTNNSGGFTVFGHVIAGTNVLALFNTFKNWTSPVPPQSTNLVLYHYYSSPLDTLPLLNPVTLPVTTDASLVYLDISLLTIQIAAKTNRTCDLSWNSVANMTNYVEYTTNLPPAWQPLFTTNGNGTAMKITETVTNKTPRFYRIRLAN
jgi:cyclophilin family peptidyl-prolyl cis-trans isomerase